MGSFSVHTNEMVLSDSGLSGIIASEYADVRVVQRIPERGSPPAGVPFSVKVEVETYRTGGPAVMRTPFACLDAFVAVRGLYKHNDEVLGGAFVRTSAFSACRGTATIQFDPKFRAGADDFVQFELYRGGTAEWLSNQTTLQDIKDGRLDPISVSNPMNFSKDQKTLEEAGLVQSVNETNLFTSLQSGFGDVRKTALSLAALGAIGVGGYFLVLNSAAIRKVVSRASK